MTSLASTSARPVSVWKIEAGLPSIERAMPEATPRAAIAEAPRVASVPPERMAISSPRSAITVCAPSLAALAMASLRFSAVSAIFVTWRTVASSRTVVFFQKLHQLRWLCS